MYVKRVFHPEINYKRKTLSPCLSFMQTPKQRRLQRLYLADLHKLLLVSSPHLLRPLNIFFSRLAKWPDSLTWRKMAWRGLADRSWLWTKTAVVRQPCAPPWRCHSFTPAEEGPLPSLVRDSPEADVTGDIGALSSKPLHRNKASPGHVRLRTTRSMMAKNQA